MENNWYRMRPIGKAANSAMSDPWVMYAAVLFGIAVAVAGVIAYLRMIKQTKNGERRNNRES